MIYNGLCRLAECPVWHVNRQKLYWTDIYNKRIWEYDGTTHSSRLFWEGAYQVGGFAFTKHDDLILFTDKGVFLLPGSGGPDDGPELLYDVSMKKHEMFNDITVDPEGRIYAGTLDRKDFDGTLYRFEKNKDPVQLLHHVKCSNGMTFSLDEEYFYHTDSLRYTITKYDYNRNTGEIENPRIFYKGSESRGLPDGITIDTENNIWAAFWGSGTIRQIDEDGIVIDEVEVPAVQPSSLIFGGSNLNEIFITSSCQGASDLTTGRGPDGRFLGGKVYAYKSPATGRPEWPADF